MKNHLCDWVNYNEIKKNIEKDITQNKKTITPWQALSVIDSPKLLKDNTMLFIDNKEFNNQNLILVLFHYLHTHQIVQSVIIHLLKFDHLENKDN